VTHRDTRRSALRGLGLGAAALAIGCRGTEPAASAGSSDPSAGGARGRAPAGDVPAPTVDLMKEHGLLDRVLLVYDESARRIEAGQPPPEPVVRTAAEIVRDFVEDVHETIEERWVFPLLKDAGRHEALVQTLLRQHEAGREVTAYVLEHAGDGDARLRAALASFTRMYRPHSGREDTVIFTSFREVATPAQHVEVMEGIETLERQRMGEDGYERFLATVADLERQLGIHELEQFTPGPPRG
jgi:hemerythrin-like domain-containing protein